MYLQAEHSLSRTPTHPKLPYASHPKANIVVPGASIGRQGFKWAEVYVNGKWRVDGPSNVDVSAGPNAMRGVALLLLFIF